MKTPTQSRSGGKINTSIKNNTSDKEPTKINSNRTSNTRSGKQKMAIKGPTTNFITKTLHDEVSQMGKN